MESGDLNVRHESRKVNFSTYLFVVVTLLFLVACVLMTWYGCSCIHKFFTQWYLKSWEKWSVLFGLGAFVLFFQIIIELFETGTIPNGYKEITKSSHPALFGMIDEVRKKLKLTRDIRVYLTNETSASIFVLPAIRNLVRIPERHLSIGSPLIENLPENELLAVLFHEFAHFSQDTINTTSRAASIGMFANSFLKERIEYKASYGPGNMTLGFMILYYTFLDYLCRYIKRHYERLSDELEFEADKIAIQHVKPEDLSQALLHIVSLAGAKEVPYTIKKRVECMGVDRSELSGFVQNGSEHRDPKIRISLRHRRRFFPWVDYTYPLLLNGKEIGEGNLRKGFTIEKEVAPDLYTLEVSSFISTFDMLPYTFEADEGCLYCLELDFKFTFFKSKYTIYCHKMKVSNLD